jgi:hypothetical protein
MIIKQNTEMSQADYNKIGNCLFKAHFWFGFDALAELFSDDYTAIVSDDTVSVYNTNKLNS